MSNKAEYQTKQKDELLSYLEKEKGKHLTVGDICEHFRECGRPIGTTTVYRHLEKMINNGSVAKYSIDANTPACFEYIGDASRKSGYVHYHCKCEICGKLIHLRCRELPIVEEHIKEHHGFTVNPSKTVLYGICESCRNTK